MASNVYMNDNTIKLLTFSNPVQQIKQSKFVITLKHIIKQQTL